MSDTCLRQSARKLSRALYVVYGSEDLLMEEISLIGQKIGECTGEDARIIFGVVVTAVGRDPASGGTEGERENGVRVVLVGA